MEKFITGTGQHILVHDKDDCSGNCPIHNQSDHHMKSWPLHWRDDKGIFERIDPLGVGHPDPDSIKYIEKCYGIEVANSVSLHGCDGFCNEENYKKWLVKNNNG